MTTPPDATSQWLKINACDVRIGDAIELSHGEFVVSRIEAMPNGMMFHFEDGSYPLGNQPYCTPLCVRRPSPPAVGALSSVDTSAMCKAAFLEGRRCGQSAAFGVDPNSEVNIEHDWDVSGTRHALEMPGWKAAPLLNDSLALAIRFHETYERLAPSFGYETRKETRAFDKGTPNGMLMIAVCAEMLRSLPVPAVGAAEMREACAKRLEKSAEQYDIDGWPDEADALRREAAAIRSLAVPGAAANETPPKATAIATAALSACAKLKRYETRHRGAGAEGRWGVSDFDRCKTCGDYGWLSSHRCPPSWIVWCPDYHGDDPEDGRTFYALDADGAAEKWAEHFDSDGDYTIISGSPQTVRVVRAGEDDSTAVWLEVSGESVPRYHAEETETPAARAGKDGGRG